MPGVDGIAANNVRTRTDPDLLVHTLVHCLVDQINWPHVTSLNLEKLMGLD